MSGISPLSAEDDEEPTGLRGPPSGGNTRGNSVNAGGEEGRGFLGTLESFTLEQPTTIPQRRPIPIPVLMEKETWFTSHAPCFVRRPEPII
jgi:hypothetical protein